MAGFRDLYALTLVIVCFSHYVHGEASVSVSPAQRQLAGRPGDPLSLTCTAHDAPTGARLCWYLREHSEWRRAQCVTGADSVELSVDPARALTAEAGAGARAGAGAGAGAGGVAARCELQLAESPRSMRALARSDETLITVMEPSDLVSIAPARAAAAEAGDTVWFQCAAPGAPDAQFSHLLLVSKESPVFTRHEYTKGLKVSKDYKSLDVSCAFQQKGGARSQAALASRAVPLRALPAAPPALDLVPHEGAPNLTLRRKKTFTNVEVSSESSSEEDSDEDPRLNTVGFGDVYSYKCTADKVVENARLCLYQLDKGRDKKTEKLTCQHNVKQITSKFFLANSAQDSRILCIAQVFDDARQAFVTIAKSQPFTITFTRQSNTHVELHPEGEVTAAAGDWLRLACRAARLSRREQLVWIENGGWIRPWSHRRVEKVEAKFARAGGALRRVQGEQHGATLRCAARARDEAQRAPVDSALSHPLTLRVIEDGLRGIEERTLIYVRGGGVSNVTVAARGRVSLACAGARGRNSPISECLAWFQTRPDQSRVLLSAACGGAREVHVTLMATAADAGSALHCAALPRVTAAGAAPELARTAAIPIFVQ